MAVRTIRPSDPLCVVRALALSHLAHRTCPAITSPPALTVGRILLTVCMCGGVDLKRVVADDNFYLWMTGRQQRPRLVESNLGKL